MRKLASCHTQDRCGDGDREAGAHTDNGVYYPDKR